MRIFQVCGDAGVDPLAPRGSGVHLRATAAGLAARGHEIVSFAARFDPNERHAYPAPLFDLAALNRSLEGPAGIGRADVIYERYSLGHEATLMPGHSSGDGACTCDFGAGTAISDALSCPLVLEVNAPLVLESQRHRGLQAGASHFAREKQLFARADHIVAVSETMRGYIAGVLGGGGKVSVVPNGFHPSLFPGTRGAEAEPPRIVFCGNPRPWHGLETLAPMLARVLEDGHRAVVRIIGGSLESDPLGRETLESLQAAALSFGVEDLIQVTGCLSQAEVAQELHCAAVAVAPFPALPLFYFSPIKIFEYMAAGLPIVTTLQGDLPAIVDDTAILVPPGNVTLFSKAVGRLLEDPKLRQRLGSAARSRALANFTWDAAAERLEGVLKALCAEPVAG